MIGSHEPRFGNACLRDEGDLFMLCLRTLRVTAAVALLSGGLAVTPRVVASEAAPIVGQPQIFVDDVRIDTKRGVVRKVHSCQKLPGPVLEPEHPWEGHRVYVFGSVHYDPTLKQFRMWCAGKRPLD